MTPLAGIPVKPFGVAKARLAPLLDGRARRRLGQALALRTAALVAAAGAEPVVVTADAGVARWAGANDLGVLIDPGAGLDAAAATVVAAAGAAGRPWAVVHADLPMLRAAELSRLLLTAASADVVLAPARDGGTNVAAGNGPFAFRYGPASFHRHLRSAPHAAVVTAVGLAIDLDTPDDFAAAAAHPAGAWLAAYVPAAAAT